MCGQILSLNKLSMEINEVIPWTRVKKGPTMIDFSILPGGNASTKSTSQASFCFGSCG